MFSIICVYNNKQICDEWLSKSLQNQTAEYELILLDNCQNKFKSAAEALNAGGDLANNEYLVFVHQDIDFLDHAWLEKAESMVMALPNLGIAGVAGKKDRSGVLTNILHDVPQRAAGHFTIQEVTEVQTLDECMVVIPRSVFKSLRFDETTCDHWHLYAVDYCLSAKSLGYEVYLLPLTLHHRSPGFSFSEDYYRTLGKICKKHKKHYPEIFTTMGDWNTSQSIRLRRNIIWRIGRKLVFLFKKHVAS